MLKRFNKTRICCPVVYEEINAVFLERKRLKNDKNPNFQGFYAIFVIFLINFVD